MLNLDNMKSNIEKLIGVFKINTRELLRYNTEDKEVKNAIFLHCVMILYWQAIVDLIQENEFKIFLNRYIKNDVFSESKNIEELIQLVLKQYRSLEDIYYKRKRTIAFACAWAQIGFGIEGILAGILELWSVDVHLPGIPGIILVSVGAFLCCIFILTFLLDKFNEKNYQYVTGERQILQEKLRPFVDYSLIQSKETKFLPESLEDATLEDEIKKIFSELQEPAYKSEIVSFRYYSRIKAGFFELKANVHRSVDEELYDKLMSLNLAP